MREGEQDLTQVEDRRGMDQGQAPVDPNITALADGLEMLTKALNRLRYALFVTQAVAALAGIVYLATRPRGRR